MRSDRMIRQVTSVIVHHLMQFVPAMKHFLSVVAMGIKMPMPHSVGTNFPDVRITADDYNIPIDHGRNINVIGHRLIYLLDHHGRRRWIESRDHCIDFDWVDNELALIVGNASRD